MEFLLGEKVITAKEIKAESGEMIKCAEEVYVTQIRPDIISIQWNKDKRELNALTPPDAIFKRTESNRETADNRKAFLELLAMEKKAIDLGGFLKNVKDYWDKNKANVKSALEFIGKTVKNRIADFTGELDKLYNGLKGIIGVQYADTLSQYIPELAASKVAALQTKMIRTSANIDSVLLIAKDDLIPSDSVYDAILYKLSNLTGGHYEHSVIEKVVPTVAEYSDETKAFILKLSRLAENYRVAQEVLPLSFVAEEDRKLLAEHEDKACEIADKYDTKSKKLKTKQIVKNDEDKPSQIAPAKAGQPEFAEVSRSYADPNSTSGHFF